MRREDVLEMLKKHEAELRQKGVNHAAVFGSYARQEERPESDIDILIELNTARSLDLFAYAELKSYIATFFDRSVDVIDHAALKKGLRGPVKKEAVYAF